MGMSGSFRVFFDAVNAAVEMVKTFVIKLLAAAVVEDVPLAQGDDAFAVAQGVIHLMQRDDHGNAVVLVDVAQGVHHDACRFRVQRGDGFVSENDLRLLHQRAGNRHTLLLAAGECGNALMGKVHHANAGQRL